MPEIEFAGETMELKYRDRPSVHFDITVRYQDEGTDEDMRKLYRVQLSKLLKGIDGEDLPREILSKDMQRRIEEGARPVPHKRRDLTVGLLQMALDRLEERMDTEGEIEQVIHVEVREYRTVRETRYET